ncbi:MAG TPA: hypothetical protein VKK79_20060 [Candidatus Lokiarchaeia archaeon]|nr:hypothetical protein [Candidatus Lokiarchaeia archaeon]
MSHKVPADLEVPDPIVQHIQITHNFISSWMITQEEGFNGISYYDPEHTFVILLVLETHEDGQDFRIIIEQVNDFLLTGPEPEEIDAELNKIFKLAFSVLKARESVLLKLATEEADLKMQIHDLTKNIDVILKHIRDASTRILLYLIIHEPATFDDLSYVAPVTPTWLQDRLQSLIDRGLVILKENQYWIALE